MRVLSTFIIIYIACLHYNINQVKIHVDEILKYTAQPWFILYIIFINEKRLRIKTMIVIIYQQGFRNDFQEAMEQVDQAYLNEILTSSKSQNLDGKGDVNVPDEGVTYEDIEKMSTKLNKGDKDFDMNVITLFVQYLVQMWGNQLNSRSTAEKMSTKGKMNSATYAQTREYLKPLLRKLKNKSLPEDITDSLTEIVKHLLQRNYILVYI